MKPHLSLAHSYWEKVVRPGSRVIDATVGNGHDTLYLAQLLKGQGELSGYDIQEAAIGNAKKRVESLPEEFRKIISWKHQCHAFFEEQDVDLIVYNLGYLPGADKGLTTRSDTTLHSVKSAQMRLAIGGAISITCYPGHEEGEKEQRTLVHYLSTLGKGWLVCHHVWINRPLSPTLIWLQSLPREV